MLEKGTRVPNTGVQLTHPSVYPLLKAAWRGGIAAAAALSAMMREYSIAGFEVPEETGLSVILPHHPHYRTVDGEVGR